MEVLKRRLTKTLIRVIWEAEPHQSYSNKGPKQKFYQLPHPIAIVLEFVL